MHQLVDAIKHWKTSLRTRRFWHRSRPTSSRNSSSAETGIRPPTSRSAYDYRGYAGSKGNEDRRTTRAADTFDFKEFIPMLDRAMLQQHF